MPDEVAASDHEHRTTSEHLVPAAPGPRTFDDVGEPTPPDFTPPGDQPPEQGPPAVAPPGYPPSGHHPPGYQPGYGPPGYQPPGNVPPGYPQGYAPYGYAPPRHAHGARPRPVDVAGRPIAQWWRRLLAFLIDMLVLGVPWTIALAVVQNGSGTNSSATLSNSNLTAGDWVAFGVGIVVVIGYFSFLDGSPRGQTLGKLVLDIAVRDARTGGPIGAGKALGRRVFFFATYLGFGVLFLLNALSPLWDARGQGWHDKLASSCVVELR